MPSPSIWGMSISDCIYDQALAVLYLYAASTGGHPGALMAMGYRHLHGYGVPQAMDTTDDLGVTPIT